MTPTSLAWILLFLPLIVAAANHLLLKRIGLAPYASLASAAVTLGIAILLLGKSGNADIPWLTVYDFKPFELTVGVTLDKLSTGMMLVVTGVGFLVHLFSLAYMKDDEAKARYFTGLSLFMFSMTGIVLSSNFIMTFMFWELVGLSSYLLIGHWYQKPSAGDAAKKAFITNRIGDFGFMIGILLLWGLTGTLGFSGMATGLKDFGVANADYFAQHSAAYHCLLSVALLCVFCGAVGKSAQLPLHVWLPDAMEGPTPVSALIHAATMVAAGVYMLFRVQLSLDLPHELLESLLSSKVIAWTGGLTALAAALMATQQDDIKRVLAYSTLSQLGYMVMAVGLVAGEAGMFHLFTHAWFKALLFLGSGAVIYACHHEQDIWKMGGLLKKMPITGLTFLLGTAALIAVPFTSGFFSKEHILEAAHHHNPALFWVAAFVAMLTPFYMTRMVVVAFFGKPRDEGADHAHEVGPLMSLPLIILAILGTLGGLPFIAKLAPALPHGADHFAFHVNFISIVSFIALIVGVAAGLVLYKGKDKDPLNITLFRERLYIDRFYDNFLVRYFQNAAATIVHFLDELFINAAIVDGFSKLTASFGNLFRRLQSGNLQGYAFIFGLGVILVIYFTVFF